MGDDGVLVFCFGSNGIEQLRERCKNPKLEAQKACLPGYSRIFAGTNARWNGAVASITEVEGYEVRGSVVRTYEHSANGGCVRGILKPGGEYISTLSTQRIFSELSEYSQYSDKIL